MPQENHRFQTVLQCENTAAPLAPPNIPGSGLTKSRPEFGRDKFVGYFGKRIGMARVDPQVARCLVKVSSAEQNSVRPISFTENYYLAGKKGNRVRTQARGRVLDIGGSIHSPLSVVSLEVDGESVDDLDLLCDHCPQRRDSNSPDIARFGPRKNEDSILTYVVFDFVPEYIVLGLQASVTSVSQIFL